MPGTEWVTIFSIEAENSLTRNQKRNKKKNFCGFQNPGAGRPERSGLRNNE
jgi:hypothetical protein